MRWLACARPPGGSHGRITRDSAQHEDGAKGKPRPRGVSKSAAKGSIKAGARTAPTWCPNEGTAVAQ